MLFDFFLRLGLLLARAIPFSAMACLCAGLGRLAGLLSPARKTVRENLLLLGDERARVSSVFASYGRYWGELLSLAARPSRLAALQFHVTGLEHLHRAQNDGPLCFLSAHLGNWDLLAFWMARELGEFTVAVEELRPARLFRLFRRIRERGGLRVIAAGGGGLSLFRSLKEGHPTGLVADRVFGAGKQQVPFFQGHRNFPSAGIDLAHRAGATLLPIFLVREAHGYAITIHSPLPEGGDSMEAWAGILEEELRAAADQYCLLYPLIESKETKEETA
ncbi:MAG: hypothetical protein QGG33_03455 [Candidatus Krumholzibacteria bacterium]|jgi:KDO2-lipid IV(A) lauroyltransferase|nr:hypothetical protein [Candidatus Krumholzibacteria bacterium]